MKQVWKTIEKYPNYEVSNYGKVRNKTTGRQLKAHPNSSGYLRVPLFKNGKSKQVFVHRLVAEAFIPNPHNKKQVNHIKKPITNNRVNNLEWCNQSDNIIHQWKAKERKKSHKGEKILCVETNQVFNTQQQAADFAGVHRKRIYEALEGLTKTAGGYHWKYIKVKK